MAVDGWMFCPQEDRMSKAKVSDILSEIFKKIGSKENTKEVSPKQRSVFVIFVSDENPKF